jgi:hypothetical protein
VTRRPLIAIVLAAWPLLGACAQGVSYDGTAFRCDESPKCPVGYECVKGVCERPDGVQPDASVPDAGTADAAVADATPRVPDAGIPDVADATPRAPDAMPPPPDAACTDTVVQLLSNPDYDLGLRGWVEVSAFRIITEAAALPTSPHSGDYAVWLGGALSSVDALYQEIVVPPGAEGLRLRGFRLTATAETSRTTNFDTLRVAITDTAGRPLETLLLWGNLDANADWELFRADAVGSYANQRIRLHLESRTDSSNNTNFFIDTLALETTVCR